MAIPALRDFQQHAKARVYAEWQAGRRGVLLVLPTGGGKTVLFSSVLHDVQAPACVIAHRSELVAQASLALNRCEVPHGILAPKGVISQTVALHMDTCGHSCYAASAPVRVASVDTLPNVRGQRQWFESVRVVISDEGHHVLRANKWGEALARFPNAVYLLPTAHAVRADGAGLGSHADGLADALVLGPSCRDLIRRGFLCDYRLVAPPSDVDISNVPIGSTGDFNQARLRAAVHKSARIVGDVVAHYLKYARGKLGITFAVDVESAGQIAMAYNAAGVPAQVITANTPISVRAQYMRQFRAGRLLQLVNVDVLGEGTDVPAVQVVSMARHTNSFQLYAQQFGRALRVMVPDALAARWGDLSDVQRLAAIEASDKPRALILDHVANWSRHGLPDVTRDYSLSRRERRSRSAPEGLLALRLCSECTQPFLRSLLACPHCRAPVVPSGRSTPEQVDGDLVELDAATLAVLRGEIERIDAMPAIPPLLSAEAQSALKRRHWERQKSQLALRDAMTTWAGAQDSSVRESQKRFFLEYGIDVMTAQTLNARDADELRVTIEAALVRLNVVRAT